MVVRGGERLGEKSTEQGMGGALLAGGRLGSERRNLLTTDNDYRAGQFPVKL